MCLSTEPAQRNKNKLVAVKIEAHGSPQNSEPVVQNAKHTLYTLTLCTQIKVEGIFFLAQSIFA